MSTPTAAERAAFKRGEWERIADLHPGVPDLLYAWQRRVAELEALLTRWRDASLEGDASDLGDLTDETTDVLTAALSEKVSAHTGPAHDVGSDSQCPACQPIPAHLP